MPTIVCHHCSEIFTVDGPKPDQCPSCGRTLHIEGDPTSASGPPCIPPSFISGIASRSRLVATLLSPAWESAVSARSFWPEAIRKLSIGWWRSKFRGGETAHAVKLRLERFAREARSIAQLRHPNIVSVFDVQLDAEPPFIVCEYVNGETLSDRMRKSPLSFREAAQLIADVAVAVDYAHESGIVHRDIKPSNIMIDSTGKPRLMDFGLAKRETIDHTVTTGHAILGTPAYMSPEQAWGGKRGAVDRRSDIYALGTVLYQLLTRELPFRGEPRMVLRQVIEDDPKNPRSLNADIPRDLETICETAMHKEPGGRYQTAGALADDLEPLARAARPIEARPVTRLERSVRWCRRNPITTGLVATIAGLLVIGFCSATIMPLPRNADAAYDGSRRRFAGEQPAAVEVAYVDRANRYMDPLGPIDEYSPLEGLPGCMPRSKLTRTIWGRPARRSRPPSAEPHS